MKYKVTNITDYAPTDKWMRNKAITLTINKSQVSLKPGESTIVNVGLATPEMIKMRMNRLINIEPFNDTSATPKLETSPTVEQKIEVQKEDKVEEKNKEKEDKPLKPKKVKNSKNMFLS